MRAKMKRLYKLYIYYLKEEVIFWVLNDDGKYLKDHIVSRELFIDDFENQIRILKDFNWFYLKLEKELIKELKC